MKRLLTLFLVSLLFVGCGGGSSPNSPSKRAKAEAAKAASIAAQKNAPAVSTEADSETPTSFRFSGTNHLNKSCNTGPRQFSTRQLLCVNIQDAAQNNSCALDKRAAKFQRDCAPEFTWNESLSCRFALLDGAAEIAVNGEYAKKYERMAGELCAGRTPNGKDEPGSSGKGNPLLDDLLSDVEIQFVPAAGTTGHARSHFKMSIYRNDQAGQRKPLAGEFQFASGFKAVSGPLGDSKYKYVIRCESVWACPAK